MHKDQNFSSSFFRFQGCSYCDKYRFGFNGQEKDDEVKGNGNSYDFGARIYDSRLGRWLGCDPLQAKYPNMSPYNYCANNPIKFVDYDGKDYGVIVDKESKTIIIVSNIFTVSEKSFQQASAAASELNSLQKNVTLDGVDYALSFEVKIFPPITDATGTAFDGDYSSTPYSNVFYGTTETKFLDGSNKVEGGGASGNEFTMYNIEMPNAKYKEFNDTYNMGDYPQLVGHEMLHTMGLDDKFNRTTGKPQPYYSEDGRMNYVGTRDNKFKMNTISNQDIKNILQYAIDKNGTDTGTDPKAIIWEDNEDFPLQSASEINVSDTPATK